MRSETILVVDPDPDSRFIFTTVLAARGFRTLEATDGQQALLLAASYLPAAVVVELRVPALDGYQLMRLLRSGERTSRIRIVLATALPVVEDASKTPAWDAYLPKPIVPGELVEAIESLLSADPTADSLETIS